MGRWIGIGLRFVRTVVIWLVLLGAMVYLLNYSTLPMGDEWTQVAVIARNEQFDYVSWELNALAVKADQTLYGLQPFMDEPTRSAYVRSYMNDLGQAQRFEVQIDAVYADPTVADHAAVTADLRAQRDTLRADLSRRQALTEAILEGQVAAVLVDQGFQVGRQLLPPISMHFTQVPNLLIVSPRDQIRFDISINLDPMPVDAIETLESQIDQQLDVSSLIVPLGGIALYPAMILETSSIPFATETFAHEWLHHYLFFFPLGLDYEFANETRIINETTANLFGKEVSRLVLARYYPDLLPPPSIPREQPDDSAAPQTPTPTPDPNRFDYGSEMNATRIHVDELLAAGEVDEAEAYMERRRQVFVEHGYLIRKLNQAYFAFYGGYQSGTPGEGGCDPIGPAVQAVRDQSDSIYDWIGTMRGVVSRADLLGALDADARASIKQC